MKYLGLAYWNPEKFAAMAPEDVKALVSQCPPLDKKMQATGKMLVFVLFGEPKDWVSLRLRGGRPQITDGPYAEAKEMVGGMFIIEADNRDEALRLAAMHPAATLGEAGGWGIELIPLDFFLGGV